MNTHSIDSTLRITHSNHREVNGLNPRNQLHGVGLTSRVNKYFMLLSMLLTRNEDGQSTTVNYHLPRHSKFSKIISSSIYLHADDDIVEKYIA